MLLVCCFCDNVGDDTMGRRHWQDLEVYRVPRNPKPKDTTCHTPPAIIACRVSRTQLPSARDAASQAHTFLTHRYHRNGRSLRQPSQ